MPSLADLLAKYLKGHDFGPEDSTILSSLYHPGMAAQKFGGFVQNNANAALGNADPYDNPTPYYGATDAQRASGAMTLAGLMQTGALPFGPKGAGTLGAIPVWHGSPHKFDKFDMSKIGTGEGAQAYGHGLYFAESPRVATSYADNISPDPKSDLVGWSKWMLGSGIDQNDIGSILKNSGKNDIEIQDILSSAKSKDYSGNLYKTALEWPDAAREASDPLGPQHFLDWDRPLSEQPESVQKKLKEIYDQSYLLPYPDKAATPKTGQYIYDDLKLLLGGVESKDPLETQEMLKAYGIPGIRYLDQGSRGAGDGTYNYVVFDDQIPRIVERNGVTPADLLKKK